MQRPMALYFQRRAAQQSMCGACWKRLCGPGRLLLIAKMANCCFFSEY